jgi:hypothetical protein
MPGTIVVGQQLTVVMDVYNNGTSDLTNVLPDTLIIGGTGGAAVISGPTPASDPLLAIGNTVSFTWILDTSAAGTITLQAGASSTEVTALLPASGSVLLTAPTPTLTVTPIPPTPTKTPIMSMSISLQVPASVVVGQQLTVILIVNNTGEGTLTNVTPGSLNIAGTGTAAIISGPVPATVASLAAGNSASFTWVLNTSAPGTVLLQAGAISDQVIASTPASNSVPMLAPTTTPTTVSTAMPTSTQSPVPAITPTFTPTYSPTPGTQGITGLLAYPNPFNPLTSAELRVQFTINQNNADKIAIRIYTASYRLIREEIWASAAKDVILNRGYVSYTSDHLQNLANGVYFYYLYATGADGKETRSKIDKVIILK